MAKKPFPPGSANKQNNKKPVVPQQPPIQAGDNYPPQAGFQPSGFANTGFASAPASGDTASSPQGVQAGGQGAAFTPSFPPAPTDMPEPLRDMPQLRNAAAKNADPVRRTIGSTIADSPKPRDGSASWPFWAGLGLTFMWFAAVFFVAFDADASGKIAGLPITSVALGISGIIAPVAFLWMIIAYLQRASDIKAITEPLRRQLQMVVGTGTQAEGRVRRFNDALERQLELLRQAGDGSYDVLQNAIQVLQEEEKAINSLAERSGKEIQRIAGIVRDNSEVLEDLLHDNRERFNDLSGRIAGNIATLDQRANAASDRLGDVVERLHLLIDQFKTVADQKLIACANLSDRVGEQESRTQEAANRMNATLEAARAGADALNQILLANQDMLDQTGQRLLARMEEVSAKVQAFSESSDEKEQKLADKSRSLSQTLAREIATLEALTGRLESQIAAANEGLGEHTGALEAKQTELAQQAGSLMQSIQHTLRSLDENTQNVFDKFGAMREHVSEQSTRVMEQFSTSGSQYGAMAERLDTISHTVAERIATIGKSLDGQMESIAKNTERAAIASTQAGEGVTGALAQLEAMIGRIFDAEKRAQDSALTVTAAYDTALGGVEEKVGAISGVADAHIARLNRAHDDFEDVSQKLATRARETEGTWQSLVGAAEKQQTILQDQLREKVEEAVGLLNENAVAIEAARDSLYQQIEAGFSRSQELVDQLAKVGTMTEEPFDNALRRVKGCVEQSETQLTHFVGVLNKNADHVNELSNTLAAHGERAGHKAAEALAGLDAVAGRMEAIQHDNMKATQDVLLRLDQLVGHLQARMGDLSGTAAEEQKKLAETVKNLSFDINGLIHDSQTAENRVRLAAGVLSEQAADVRQNLEAQASAVETVAARYNELVRVSDSGLEDRVQNLGAAVRGASEMLENLGGQVDERSRKLEMVQGQLAEGGRAVEQTTQAALDRLSVFTHALVAADTASQDTAQSVYARLSDMESQFGRQVAAVNDGSEAMTQSMRKAVADLVEQSVGLAAASQQAEGRIANLAATTTALQSQAQIVRMAIETEASAMQNRMGDVLAQIESACVGLERNAVIAFDRTEGMARRFNKVSDAAFGTLGEAAMQIGLVADEAAGRVGGVTKAIGEQLTAISYAGAHLSSVADTVGEKLQGSTDMLNLLASEVGSTALYAADQLRLQVAGLKTEADQLLGRFDTLGRGLANQSVGVMNVTDALEAQVRGLNDALASAEETAGNMRRNIIGETTEFKNEMAMGMQNIATAGDALQQRGDFAIAMVHQMAGRFTEATQNLKAQFETQADRVRSVTESAQAQLEKLGAAIAGQAQGLETNTQRLDMSGKTVGETLEKANFLLRNLTGQIERMKGSAEEIGDALVKRMGDMLSACESEIKSMTGSAGTGLEELTQKAHGINQQMRDESRIVADQIVAMMRDMKGDVEASLIQVADTARAAVKQLGVDAEGALAQPAEQMIAFQNEFRDSFVDMADAIVTNLRQVQESGAQIVARIREGAAAGAGEATEALAQLRNAAEQEVRGVTVNIEQTMRQMHSIVQRLNQEVTLNGDQAQRAAMQSFTTLRDNMESEMRGLVQRANASLSELQGTCERLTHDMQKATGTAEEAGRDFGRIADDMTRQTQKIAQTVGEVDQNLHSTNALLQKSQNTLFDVANKSSEALGLFNDTIAQQARNLMQLETRYAETADHMAATDERLAVLKTGFQSVLGDLMQRLDAGMLNLGQQILAVREEAHGAAATVEDGTEAMLQQKNAIAGTAAVLAQALAQLDAVNRSLSRSMKENVDETVHQVERFEKQTERVRQASETTSQWVASLSQHMQGQLSQLAQEMERTSGQTAAIQLTRTQARNESFVTPRVEVPVTPPMPRTSYAPPPKAEPARDPLQKLRDMARQAQAEAQGVPASVQAPAPAPVARTPVGVESTRKSAPVADNDLINSLSQIIQQLEDTASGSSADVARRKAK